MDDNLAQKAILKALEGAWEDAISLNQKLLNNNPADIDALNRIARAYAETGNIVRAKYYSKRALSLEPFNKIAQKCYVKWKGIRKDGRISACPATASVFIEEPGKTKITSLLNLGSNNLLADLEAGDEVIINPQGQSVSILSPDGKYIGRLPDNIGSRIKNLIKRGNSYRAIIKSITPGSVKVLLRETGRVSKQQSAPSFPRN